MDKKFVGQFKKVNIDLVYPNEWNPKENIEDNSFNNTRYEKIKENIAKKGLYFPIIVRSIEDKYEVIDGYHRWKACKELEYVEIMIWDLGIISKEEAQAITLDSIYLNIPASEPMTSLIIKEMKINDIKSLDLLPFSPMQIDEYLKMADFKWEDLKNEENENADFRTLNIVMTIEQYNIVQEAMNKIKADNPDVSDGRILELICIEFINALPGTTGSS